MTPYAEVIGDPIAHSKSPLIHGFWLGKLGIDADYRATHVTAEGLADYFVARRADPAWRGCNVTIPHKLAALDHVEDRGDEVATTGAANTIYRRDKALIAANTDIDGILSALPIGMLSSGDEVCIIGTGGAARAALAACRRRNVGIVLLSSRNEALGWRLLKQFGFGGTSLPIEDAHNIRTSDVIINATSLGMTGKDVMPQTVLDHLKEPLPNAAVLDMVYSPVATPFLNAAEASGCRTVSGIEMLIGQAARAFEFFFGRPAPREYDAELRRILTA